MRRFQKNSAIAAILLTGFTLSGCGGSMTVDSAAKEMCDIVDDLFKEDLDHEALEARADALEVKVDAAGLDIDDVLDRANEICG